VLFVCATRDMGDAEILLSTGHRPETMRVDLVLIIRSSAEPANAPHIITLTSYGNEASEYLADSMP
jgi:hypothetical protein